MGQINNYNDYTIYNNKTSRPKKKDKLNYNRHTYKERAGEEIRENWCMQESCGEVVSVVSQFMHHLRVRHLQAVGCVLQCLVEV